MFDDEIVKENALENLKLAMPKKVISWNDNYDNTMLRTVNIASISLYNNCNILYQNYVDIMRG